LLGVCGFTGLLLQVLLELGNSLVQVFVRLRQRLVLILKDRLGLHAQVT
jgi:hypothetical protein